MTEINIILNTDFQETDTKLLKNDKELFYETINNDFNIYKLNSYSKFIIPHNQILNDFLSNDNYLDYESELYNVNSNIKKLILKKILIFFNPLIQKIIKVKNNINKSNIIIDKDSLYLNYPIEYQSNTDNKLNNIKNNQERLLPKNQYFLLNGIYNKKKYNNNLPYNLDEYKYIKKLIIKLLKNSINIDNNIEIYNKEINYTNKTVFNINTINIDALKELYILYLNYQFIYFNNTHLISNNYKLTNYKLINSSNLFQNQSKLELVDRKYSNNYIKYFNTFLNYKINNIFNNHSYYAFQSDGLLDLYEQILINSIDDTIVKNKITKLIQNEKNLKDYYKNKKIIDEYNLKYIEIEFLTRKKFPNLFNPNSKEVIFNKFKKFNIDDLPKKYKDIILIEYKKLQALKLQNIKNNCKHKQLIKDLSINKDKFNIIKNIKLLMRQTNVNNNQNEYYKCLMCSYNLICPHVLEYYELIFSKNELNSNHDFSIRQHLINKYMTSAKINMIYYCKICGEELGKSLDLEQNIEYKDKVKLNTAEYTDNTLEIIKNNTITIIYSYITFTSININISKKYLINYVINSITSHINLIEKSLRKSKNYNEDEISNILNFNSIIFIYATLIYIMTKYSFLSFTSNTYNKKGSNDLYGGKSIIVPKKIEVKSSKDLLNLIKLRFKEAYDLIISTNNILLYKLKYNNQYEKIKELLLKTYSIVAKNDQLTLSDSNTKLDNHKLLINSSIFNYYLLINNTEACYNNKKESKFKSIFKFLDKLYECNIINNKISNPNFITDINTFNKILNLKNVNFNKNDNLFSQFNSTIINKKLFDNDLIDNVINNYNEYKLLSFNLFYYHIHFELYNIPIYDYITNDDKNLLNNINTNVVESKFITDNIYLDKLNDLNKKDNYFKYIKLTHVLKKYEIELINKNIKYNLYPISFIKLNSIRYFYKNNYKDDNLNLNKYFCTKDGKPHNFNIYIYNDKTNMNKTIEFNKKELDSNINNIINLQFIDYKCSKCNQIKSKVINDNSIIDIINNNNDKDGFFNLYINVCPITIKSKISDINEYQYHDFNYDNTNNSSNDFSNLYCKICKIKYADLINKNIEVYHKFYKEYINYKNKKIKNINSKLLDLSTVNTKLYNTNINELFNSKIQQIKIISNTNNFNEIFKYINSIDLDTLIVNISKKFNINIIYLQKIGITEGYSYNDVKLINDTYNNLRINKLQSYFRTILIYYNLFKYDKSLKHNSDLQFNEIIYNLYKIDSIKNKIDKYLPDISYNLNELINMLKINTNKNENDNIFNGDKYICQFLIKLILQFILDLNNINEKHFDNKLEPFIQFIFTKIIKYDELFTNYNYSQLKQMFTEDKMPLNLGNEYDDNINYENEDDEDDLFAYNDLNIQFEDESPLDE